MTPLVLLAKSVVIFARVVIAAAMRKQSAACRYIVWLVSLSAILLVAAGILLPVPPWSSPCRRFRRNANCEFFEFLRASTGRMSGWRVRPSC